MSSRTERLKEFHEKEVPLPEGKFNVIYADPPWEYDFFTSESKDIRNHYPTLPLTEICNLPVDTFTDCNAILFLWATSPRLEEAMKVIEAWGFTYKTNMVWVKDKIGTGFYSRQQHELLLIAKKGNFPTPREDDRPASVIQSPRGKHSEKPAIVYELIEQMYPNGKYLELFKREKG